MKCKIITIERATCMAFRYLSADGRAEALFRAKGALFDTKVHGIESWFHVDSTEVKPSPDGAPMRVAILEMLPAPELPKLG